MPNRWDILSQAPAHPTTGLTYISYYDIFTVGAGYLDILAAVDNLDNNDVASQSLSLMWSGEAA